MYEYKLSAKNGTYIHGKETYIYEKENYIRGKETYIHDMGWLWLVGSIKLEVSFAKEPYERDAILQKRPIILSILLTVATP